MATSEHTRELIRRAVTAGLTANEAVSGFCSAARKALDAFDAEVGPRHLPDDDYEQVVQSSGLGAVLTGANRVERRLASLERAA